MADLKSIANMQIGGPKYPKKRRINLYQKQTKKGKIASPKSMGYFVGKFVAHRKGFGFVESDEEYTQDLFIPGGRPGRGGLCGDGEGASYIGEIQRGVR